ncbi:MAG: hypothetical protein ABIM60_06745 [candidate division WOR-3 bacterium]
MKEKIELILIQRKDEIIFFPENDPRIVPYKKIFTILKEALEFSGLPLEGVNLRYDKNFFSIFEREGIFYGILSNEEVEIEDAIKVANEKILSLKKEPVSIPKVKISPPPEEEEVKVEPHIFEEIKKILQEYVGAFAYPIFENQLKDARIDINNATLKKTKKFIINLQNAAAMIIGQGKAKDMGSKMLKILQ